MNKKIINIIHAIWNVFNRSHSKCINKSWQILYYYSTIPNPLCLICDCYVLFYSYLFCFAIPCNYFVAPSPVKENYRLISITPILSKVHENQFLLAFQFFRKILLPSLHFAEYQTESALSSVYSPSNARLHVIGPDR